MFLWLPAYIGTLLGPANTAIFTRLVKCGFLPVLTTAIFVSLIEFLSSFSFALFAPLVNAIKLLLSNSTIYPSPKPQECALKSNIQFWNMILLNNSVGMRVFFTMQGHHKKLFKFLNFRDIMIYSKSPWFHLRLPFCGNGFKSQAHHLRFFQLVLKL